MGKKVDNLVMSFALTGITIFSITNMGLSQCPTDISERNPNKKKPDTFEVEWNNGKPPKTNSSNDLYLEFQKNNKSYDADLVQDDTVMVNEAQYLYNINQKNKVPNLNNPRKWSTISVKEESGGKLNTLESSCNQPLPIELKDFEASKEGNKAILSWSTASETNNKYFGIQTKSPENSIYEWKTLEKIKSKAGIDGNSLNPLEYKSKKELKSPEGNYYFRLKQVDNGRIDSSYSNIEKISFGNRKEVLYNIYNSNGKLLHEQRNLQEFYENPEPKSNELYIAKPVDPRNSETKKFILE